MPQVTKTNNENEFRLTRSKVQHQESISTIKNTTISNSQHKQQTQQQISSPPQVSVTSSEKVSHVNTRQYLGDVSNQYITNAKPTNKRKPLGGDNAPLQKQQHRPSRPIPIASDNNNNGSTSSSSNSSNNNNNDANRLASLAVPSRLPQNDKLLNRRQI